MSEQTINVLPYLGLALVLGGMGIAFVWHISILGIRNSQREQELKSQERMRAIECGYPLDEHKPVNAGIAIGTSVPCTAFGCAFLASFLGVGSSFIWQSAAMVGITAVICGTILAYKSVETRVEPGIPRKPAPNPDAFEMAGHHVG